MESDHSVPYHLRTIFRVPWPYMQFCFEEEIFCLHKLNFKDCFSFLCQTWQIGLPMPGFQKNEINVFDLKGRHKIKLAKE